MQLGLFMQVIYHGVLLHVRYAEHTTTDIAAAETVRLRLYPPTWHYLLLSH